MLSIETVEPNTLELIKDLMSVPVLKDMRLVGGTALALQYGHRSSIDIDLFGNLDASMLDLRVALEKIGHVIVLKETENIRGYIINGVKVDIVNYSIYPWLTDPLIEDGIRLASPIDIAAMKINAIQGRGSKKDFIDMYFLLKQYTINEILDFYARKYPEHNLFRAIISLTYFDDADKQIMPKMHRPMDWNHVKQTITSIVKDYKV